VPGTVQAANYDTGGQGAGYNVSSVNGTADSYRSDGVDLETTADTTDTTGGGAGYDLGWTGSGQWTRYTVNAAGAGTYAVSLRLASPNGVTDGLHIANLAGTNLSGNINVPATGGWQDWTTVTATLTMPAGTVPRGPFRQQRSSARAVRLRRHPVPGVQPGAMRAGPTCGPTLA
jgi:hypothetical protein